jgi:hypothetical protein
LNISGKTQNYTENTAITLVDSEGNAIEDDTLVMSRGDADCAVTVNQVKTVKVSAAGYVGTVGTNYVVRGLELSTEEVEITGSPSIVGAIDTITIPSSVMDLSGVVSDKVVSVNLADYVDSSVVFSSDSNVTVTAKVVSKDSKEYTVPVSKITMNNLSSDMRASFDTSVSTLSVSVKSDYGSFDSFSADDITMSVNLATLSAGEHIVAVSISVPEGYSVDGTYRIKVAIERISQGQPGNGTGGVNTTGVQGAGINGSIAAAGVVR